MDKPKAVELARGRWTEVLVAAGIGEELLTRKKREGPCPICGGSTRFFFDDKDGRGTYHCRYCGAGDGMKLLELQLEAGFHKAALFVEEYFNGHPLPAIPRQVHAVEEGLSPVEVEKRRAKHRKLWDETRPIEKGDPVWLYLTMRIPGFDPLQLSANVVRIHPSIPYYEEAENGRLKKLGSFPAMVSAIVGPEGRCVDLHRTYLTEDGLKAPVENPKKTLASIGLKGAIRLCRPKGSLVALAEGIETALAAWKFTGIPCWSVVNTSGMKGFVVPHGIQSVKIFADNDKPDPLGRRAGLDAAHKLAERLKKEGIRVTLALPAKGGTDMANLLAARANAA